MQRRGRFALVLATLGVAFLIASSTTGSGRVEQPGPSHVGVTEGRDIAPVATASPTMDGQRAAPAPADLTTASSQTRPAGLPDDVTNSTPSAAGSSPDQPPILLQVPPIPVPDLPNPFDAFDRLSPKRLAAGTYESPTVRSLWDFSRALANAGLAVVVMWGGFGVMVKHHTRSPYHDAMELLPRVLLGALAANLTLVFAALLIDANNAIAAGIGQVGLPGYDQATPTQEGMALVITALAYGVVAVLLVLQMLMRLALLDLLIVLSPVMVLCWVLPQTQGWFRWWTGLFPTTVFQQVIQLVTLRLGAALMVELTPGSTSNALLTLFLGIAVCWLTLKVPALLRANSHRAGLSSVISLVLVSRVAGGLAARSAGGASGAMGGAGMAGSSGRAAGVPAASRPATP
jgi:hypothetical protein